MGTHAALPNSCENCPLRPQLRSLLPCQEECVARKAPHFTPQNSTDIPALTTLQVGSNISSTTPSVDVVSRPASLSCHLLIVRRGRSALPQCLPPNEPSSLPLVLLRRLNAIGPSLGPVLPFPSTSLFCSTYPTCLAIKLIPRFSHRSTSHQTFCLSILALPGCHPPPHHRCPPLLHPT